MTRVESTLPCCSLLFSVQSQSKPLRYNGYLASIEQRIIHPSVHSTIHLSPPLSPRPPCTPCLDSSTTQDPRQQGSWPPLPAQKWIISLFTPVSAQNPCCTLLRWRKKKKNISKGGNSAPPARLHLRTWAVKLDSNCINGGLCLPVGFFILSLSVHFTHFKGRKEEGKKSSSLRVCGLASFMSCDHGCPSLHWVCVQIGGEESQNERVLVIMCMRVCPSLPG